jgi:hypothetical protein
MKVSKRSWCSRPNDAAFTRHHLVLSFLNLHFCFLSPERRRVAQAGQGILTSMLEHVAAQRIVRVYEEA